MKPCTNAHSSPVRIATDDPDQRPITQASAPPGADLERQRVIRDCAHMMQTLVVRLETGDDATRARIQRRLATLVRDTQPEVTG